MTQFIDSEFRDTGDPIWYQIGTDTGLDGLFADLAEVVPFQTHSNYARSRELAQNMIDTSSLLVLDDSHNLPSQSLAVVTTAFSDLDITPARLILLRQRPNPTAVGAIRSVDVGGLTPPEVAAFLDNRGVENADDHTSLLVHAKTDGIPFAVDLFARLVTDLGMDADELLGGPFLRQERLRIWLDHLIGSMRRVDVQLLTAVCATDDHFDTDLIAYLNDTDLSQAWSSFEVLRGLSVVRRYSTDNWEVPQLIRNLTRIMASEDELNVAHLTLAAYYLGRADTEPRRSDKRFFLSAAGCLHLQRAGEFMWSGPLVDHGLAPAAKGLGHYETLLELARTEMKYNSGRSVWIDYHYCHAALILGRFDDTRSALREALRLVGPSDWRLYLALVRIEAELLHEEGYPWEALVVLEDGYSSIKRFGPHGPTVRQAETTRSMLESELGEPRQALESALSSLRRARPHERLGRAVALTRIGIANISLGEQDDAIGALSEARSLFAAEPDRRGQAWAASHLARCLADRGQNSESTAMATEAIALAESVGESSIDYLRFVESQLDRSSDLKLLNTLKDARVRLVRGRRFGDNAGQPISGSD